MASQTVSPDARAARSAGLWRRQLAHYPQPGPRRRYLALVVLITIALYYELYVGGGVATLLLPQLRMPFDYFVDVLAISNLIGAFASLLAGLTDRMGRANLVVWGLLLVGLLTLFGLPNAGTRLVFAVESCAVGFVEGIILVATPALIRDFSPQVGRATAMGFWTIGPVLGSLMVSFVTSTTLPVFGTWQSQFRICGAFGLVVFVLALLFLRELAPALRDQIMVSERDRALIEARAKGIDVEAALRNPWRQMTHLDVLGSALGVSVMLLGYYTMVGFGVIFLATVFGFSAAEANALLNWSWAANAVALIAAGMASDALRVRKPFMLAGGIGAVVTGIAALTLIGTHASFFTLAVINSLNSIMLGAAYATWMASFTETVEARNPALTATGLAIWGWLVRITVTISFLVLPVVVNTVTPLIEAPYWLAQYKQAQASGAAPGPELTGHLAAIQAAAAATPAQWGTWFWICVAGIAVFVALIFVMKGRWSPAAARADEAAHDAAVAREMARLRAAG